MPNSKSKSKSKSKKNNVGSLRIRNPAERLAQKRRFAKAKAANEAGYAAALHGMASPHGGGKTRRRSRRAGTRRRH